ncbi:MAG: glycosyltransferase family 4 protein [Nocardioidaceae bacterium]
MRGTRVGLVCGYLDPTRDGVADYARQLAHSLRTIGLDPLLVTTHDWARSAGEGTVGVTERWDARGVAACGRALRRLDLDLVHVQFAPSVFGFSRAIGLLPLVLPRSTPLVVTLHEYGVQSDDGDRQRRSLPRARSAAWSAVERSRLADRETLLLAPRAARLLVPSSEHQAVLRARLPRQAGAAVEVPIGLNIDVPTAVAVQSQAEGRDNVRRELGAAPDATLVAFFGFLHREKALDRLIAAVAAVRARRPATELLIIGGGESHSVPPAAAQQLRRELEEVSAACGMQEHVHFTGHLPEAEVSRLLRAADAAAFPFDAGVTRKSSSMLAALAAGVPVVATAAPGEVLAATEASGVLRIPPGNTAALAQALLRVLEDRALADRLTSAGRERAASQSWDAIAAAHAEVYATALGRDRAG